MEGALNFNNTLLFAAVDSYELGLIISLIVFVFLFAFTAAALVLVILYYNGIILNGGKRMKVAKKPKPDKKSEAAKKTVKTPPKDGEEERYDDFVEEVPIGDLLNADIAAYSKQQKLKSAAVQPGVYTAGIDFDEVETKPKKSAPAAAAKRPADKSAPKTAPKKPIKK